MRLEATNEEDAIVLLDKKDYFTALAVVNTVLLGILSLLALAGFRNWAVAYLCLLSVMEGAYFLARARASEEGVVDLDGCFVEFDESGFRCRQPANGRYESCNISIKDLERVVEGEGADFHVLVKEGAGGGSIKVDGEPVSRRAFHVRPFGHEKERFLDFFIRMAETEGFAEVAVVGGKIKCSGGKAKGAWSSIGLVGAYFLPLAVTLSKLLAGG